ncbi:MAG TPA: translation initiation factor IF-2, partial [Candidatus Gracilibacteria bacterium]|nr:translation initiation factor IF-2 [Candidatus Gracilibacteria bacterium]
IFLTKKKEMIVGCKVKGGKITKDSKLRVIRKDEVLTQDAQMVSLQRGVTPADDVSEGEECGIKYAGNIKVQPGDVFEAYRIEKRQRGLGEARV